MLLIEYFTLLIDEIKLKMFNCWNVGTMVKKNYADMQ